jgi:NAD+ synthase
MNQMPVINPENEKKKIVTFLKNVFKKQNIENAVIGLSGGIDSMVSFYLLKEVLPLKNIFIAHLYYDSPNFAQVKKTLTDLGFPQQNLCLMSIKKPVDEVTALLKIKNNQLRSGNIASRMRMIILYDLAKKHEALVCGTENKSENLLGYFTRFGDAASDIEPLTHLYKTHIFQLAKHLGIPEEIINKPPSAGLWKGQTDEGEMGFTYEEADQVLYLSVDKKLPLSKIEKMGFKNAKKILEWRKKRMFKHEAPYKL